MEVNKGIYIFHQVKALSKQCNVRVFAPVPYLPKWLRLKRYEMYGQIFAEEAIDGIPVEHPRVLLTPRVGRSLYGLFYAASLLKPMLRLRRTFNPHILVCFWVYPDGFANVLLAKLLGIPVIVGGRGCDINNADEYRMKKLMVTWTIRRADKVLAVSNAMKAKMMALGLREDRIRVVPNGIDDRIFGTNIKCGGACSNGSGMDRNDRTIVYCGRLSPEKGVEFLIRAFRILVEKGVSCRLSLIGQGPQEVKIRSMVKEFGLEERVSFKGEIPHEKIANLLKSGAVFCLPSVTEGWPNSVVEALACGLPVVASRVGGVAEILTSPEYGIMVRKEDPDALADGLSKALDKEWNRQVIKEAARNRTWDNVAEEILCEIRGVLS